MNNLLNILKTERLIKLVSRATQFLLIFLIVLIPFSVRHVFDSSWNFQTGAYSDFTSLSIYLSDIILGLLFLSIIVSYFQNKEVQSPSVDSPVSKLWKKGIIALSIWILLELFFSTSLPLQVYFSFRLIFLLIFTVSFFKIHVPREKIAWLFSILGSIQAFIAIGQFYLQESLGLYRIGESHLSPAMFGVAKIVSHGTTLIRGYGTFPHSNLLSAFLVCATLFNLYLIIKTYQNVQKKSHVVGLCIMLYLNVFGLFITFSRGGILALGGGLLVLITVLLLNKQFSNVLKVIVSCGTAIFISILVLAPYLSTRTTISDSAVKERVFYNHIGVEMVKNKPIFGLGSGTSVLHMKQYSKEELKPWEIQPIHNYFLLSYTDMGIGSILLIFVIIFPFLVLFKRIFRSDEQPLNLWSLTLLSIGGGFFMLFLLDHYFYTIWPTQLLLWLIVGLSASSFTWNKQAEL